MAPLAAVGRAHSCLASTKTKNSRESQLLSPVARCSSAARQALCSAAPVALLRWAQRAWSLACSSSRALESATLAPEQQVLGCLVFEQWTLHRQEVLESTTLLHTPAIPTTRTIPRPASEAEAQRTPVVPRFVLQFVLETGRVPHSPGSPLTSSYRHTPHSLPPCPRVWHDRQRRVELDRVVRCPQQPPHPRAPWSSSKQMKPLH